MNRSAIVVAAILMLSSFAFAGEAAETKTCRSDNAVVHYSGISDDYAKALDRVAESARAAAIETFGFDMPESISIDVADRDAFMFVNALKRSGFATLRWLARDTIRVEGGQRPRTRLPGVRRDSGHQQLVRVLVPENQLFLPITVEIAEA